MQWDRRTVQHKSTKTFEGTLRRGVAKKFSGGGGGGGGMPPDIPS